MANITRQLVVGLSLATSARDASRYSAIVITQNADPGAIVCECTAKVTTSLVTARFRLQSTPDNGTTWFDLTGVTFTTAAGTGVEVVTTQTLSFPISAWAHLQVRCVAILEAASTASADKTQVNFHYVPFARLFLLK